MVRRLVFGFLGWCCVGLAFAGVLLPGVPATVFVLCAAWFFTRSSPRFEAWLLGNRWLGPRLASWRASRGMSRAAKAGALVSMWTAISLSCLVLARVNPTAAWITTALGLAGTVTILFVVRTVPQNGKIGRTCPLRRNRWSIP
jgi:hypothetical protein